MGALNVSTLHKRPRQNQSSHSSRSRRGLTWSSLLSRSVSSRMASSFSALSLSLVAASTSSARLAAISMDRFADTFNSFSASSPAIRSCANCGYGSREPSAAYPPAAFTHAVSCIIAKVLRANYTCTWVLGVLDHGKPPDGSL
jgi:hypothetical protein